MLCSQCGKNEATIHITEIEDDSIVKVHLCEECAREKGIEMSPPESISEIISSLTEIKSSPEEEGLTCPECGITFKEMRAAGRFGCGKCYHTFRKNLEPLIKTLHKAVYHTGKVPASFEKTAGTLQILKKKLREAVRKEEYENAALLRDRIRELVNEEKPDAQSGPAETDPGKA